MATWRSSLWSLAEIDFTHSPNADLTDDFVMSETVYLAEVISQEAQSSLPHGQRREFPETHQIF